MIALLFVLQDRGLQSAIYRWPELVSPSWRFFLIFCGLISTAFHISLIIQNSALVTQAVWTLIVNQFILAHRVGETRGFQSGCSCSRRRRQAYIYGWSLTCFQILKIANEDLTRYLIRVRA